MVFSILMASSSVSYAATPTLDSEFATLVVGTNDLKVKNYDGSQTMAGCFTAPKKGSYSFAVVNIGGLTQKTYLLDNNFAEINYKDWSETTNSYSFGTYQLESGEKIYFYALRVFTNKSGTLASRIIISDGSEQKSDVQVSNKMHNSKDRKIKISKKSCSLKKGKKIKLKLKNNNKKVIWVSREKKIASVTSKGVIKGRKKGTTYIYAIANHKLYKCKVRVK